MTYKILEGVSKQAWLDDEIICSMLQKGLNHFRATNTVIMDTHFLDLFYPVDGGVYDYSRVKKWTKTRYAGTKTLFDDNVVVHFPFNYPRGGHWVHGYVHMKSKTICINDSYHSEGIGTFLCNILLEYLVMECKDKLNKELNRSEWKIQVNTEIPKQKDGFNCGVFTILNALRVVYKESKGSWEDGKYS